MNESNKPKSSSPCRRVDSSVAAVLLLKEGYDVTGMFAVNYDAELQKNAKLRKMRNYKM